MVVRVGVQNCDVFRIPSFFVQNVASDDRLPVKSCALDDPFVDWVVKVAFGKLLVIKVKFISYFIIVVLVFADWLFLAIAEVGKN